MSGYNLQTRGYNYKRVVIIVVILICLIARGLKVIENMLHLSHESLDNYKHFLNASNFKRFVDPLRPFAK